MSYILDALRRADTERQQGQVPGLHAAGAASVTEPPRQQRVLWAAAALLLALVLLALAWLMFMRPAAPALRPALPPEQPAAALKKPAPVEAPSAAASPLPIVVSAAPAAISQVRPEPVPAAVKSTAPVASAPPVSKPVVRNTPLSALSPEERRQLPALVPGGSVWSDSAASRFVILDGQVLREGDALAPGLQLEKIERRVTVLRWKDQRIEVPF